MKKDKHIRSWRRNWSSRGVAMMNFMENFATKANHINRVNEPSYAKKLDFLLEEYPINEFYRSLENWISKGMPLTEKQIQAIDKGYYSLKKLRSN